MPGYQFPLDSDPVYNTRIRFTTYNVKPIQPGKFEGLASGFSDLLKDNVGKGLNGVSNALGNIGFSNTAGLASDAADAITGIQVNDPEAVAKREAAQQAAEEKASSTVNDFLGALSGYSTDIDTSAPTISMYIPLSMTFNDNIMYDNANMGAIGATIGKALEAGSGIFSSLGRGLFEGTTNTIDILANGLGESLDKGTARLALQRAVNAAVSIPGVPQTLGTTATLALQTSVNPNTRALFRGVALREFSFNFNMTATSRSESEAIENIIGHFRERMYPEVYDPFGDKSNIPFAYNFPDIFQIAFKIGTTDIKVPAIDFCYLRNCQVVYNPTGATFHDDGYASEVQMTLTFMEYKTLAKQDIQKGY